MSILSDKILTRSGYISGCPWPCSTGGKGAKSTDKNACIVAANMGVLVLEILVLATLVL